MTCYLRHLGPVLLKAGIIVTKENRKQVGSVIQTLVGESRDCPAVWRKVKQQLATDEAAFIAQLREAWKNQPSTR